MILAAGQVPQETHDFTHLIGRAEQASEQLPHAVRRTRSLTVFAGD